MYRREYYFDLLCGEQRGRATAKIDSVDGGGRLNVLPVQNFFDQRLDITSANVPHKSRVQNRSRNNANGRRECGESRLMNVEIIAKSVRLCPWSKYHQRQLVDASDPAYQEAHEGMTEYHQQVDCSDPAPKLCGARLT